MSDKMTAEQQELVCNNMYLVDEVLKQSRAKFKPNLLEDVRSSASLVLCNCVMKYDSKKGKDFETYAKVSMCWNIHKFLQKEFNKGMSYSNSLPTKVLKEAIQFETVTDIDDIVSTLEDIRMTEDMIDLTRSLTEEEQAVFSRLIEGMKIKEIAGEMNMHYGKTAKICRNIKEKMKDAFESADID